MDWAAGIATRDRRVLARAITALDDASQEAAAIVAATAGRTGRAHVLGITGPPGAGKSTLTNALIGAYLARAGTHIAVVAVDPSSPISGGAVLGDRIRMLDHHDHERVYIRSLATRGHLGGVTRTTRQVVELLDAAGFDVVIVETVGVGQSEVEVARIAQTLLLVCPPYFGDDVQAMKAGIFEIADLFVVNKADMPQAAQAESRLNTMLTVRGARGGWRPQVLRTIATTGEGVPALVAAIDAHRTWRGAGAAPTT